MAFFIIVLVIIIGKYFTFISLNKSNFLKAIITFWHYLEIQKFEDRMANTVSQFEQRIEGIEE